MMGHKEKTKGAMEWDVITGWRHVVKWCRRAGAKKYIKKRMQKRARKDSKQQIKKDLDE